MTLTPHVDIVCEGVCNSVHVPHQVLSGQVSSPIYICGANVSCIVVLGTLQGSCVMGNGMVMECSCESSLPLVVKAMLTPAQSGVDLVFHA